ncbi:hypothetical protein F5876DRAFT_73552 [Lentinula aff. lateritia]|uniref:Uncharacterized protein n=1 Tax=Lentinula aff. lateritia TaxID=2804960 RepID=A0ACC1U9K9_9AGAR|nr:hypothetical protein F5876DRAFT_73552 [Lentinula aff. lateritia]
MNDESHNEQLNPCVGLYLRPDIQELIRSNEEPSPSVLHEISSRLQVIHKGELLGELEQEARAYASILHPIRKIPIEVLFNILGTVALPQLGKSLPETYLPRAKINPLEPMRTLLALNQVCSRWRAIMLSSPQFWSYISLITTNTIDWEDSESVVYDLLDQQLERSQNHPLTIALEFRKSKAYLDSHIATPLSPLNNLMSHSGRWERLFVKNTCLFEFVPIKSTLSSLRVLHISIPSHQSMGPLAPSSPWWQKGADVFKAAPVLEEIWLKCPPNLVPHLPWDQILRFRLKPTHSSGRALSLLYKTSKLTSCILDDTAPHAMETSLQFAPLSDRVKLHSLRSLTFNIYDNMEPDTQRGIYQVLGWISAPALESLEFSGVELDQDFLDAFAWSLQNSCSSSRLKQFRLATRRSAPALLVNFLQILPPGVTHLSLKFNTKYYDAGHSGNVIFQALRIRSPESSSHVLLPHLETLYVHTNGYTADLLDMLESRLQSNLNSPVADPVSDSTNILPLKHCTIKGRDAVGGNLLSETRANAFRAGGLNLEIVLHPLPSDSETSIISEVRVF